MPVRHVGQLDPHTRGGELPDELARVMVVPAGAAERAANRERPGWRRGGGPRDDHAGITGAWFGRGEELADQRDHRLMRVGAADQAAGLGHQPLPQPAVGGQRRHGPRHVAGRIRHQHVHAVGHVEARGADGAGDHGEPVAEGLQQLDPGPAARGQGRRQTTSASR